MQESTTSAAVIIIKAPGLVSRDNLSVAKPAPVILSLSGKQLLVIGISRPEYATELADGNEQHLSTFEEGRGNTRYTREEVRLDKHTAL